MPQNRSWLELKCCPQRRKPWELAWLEHHRQVPCAVGGYTVIYNGSTTWLADLQTTEYAIAVPDGQRSQPHSTDIIFTCNEIVYTLYTWNRVAKLYVHMFPTVNS